MQLRTTPGLWVMLALSILLLPLPWIAALVISCIVHELSHLAAAKLAGVHIKAMRIGIDGAYLETDAMTPLQEMFCSWAGPFGALMLLIAARWMPRTAICVALQSAYHLLPCYPLDGGRGFRALVAYFGWPHWILGIVECIMLTGLVLFGFFLQQIFGTFLPLMGVIVILLRVSREKFLAKRTGTGYNRDTSE